jgi:hypothetical protein
VTACRSRPCGSGPRASGLCRSSRSSECRAARSCRRWPDAAGWCVHSNSAPARLDQGATIPGTHVLACMLLEAFWQRMQTNIAPPPPSTHPPRRRITDGPFRVDILTTLDTDLPSVPFGVAATAYSNDDDSQHSGAVSVSLVVNGGGNGGCWVAASGGQFFPLGGGGAAGRPGGQGGC